MNPVRARMAKTAEDYGWSSARAHLGLKPPPAWLDPLNSNGTGQFQRHWPTPAHWQQSLATLTRREAAALRQATRADTALGSDEFISQLEQRYGIQLRPQPLGRPRKPPATGQLRSTITLADDDPGHGPRSHHDISATETRVAGLRVLRPAMPG